MGGAPIRHEPIIHDMLLQDVQCEHYFRMYGWIDYFMKIIDFNEEIAYELMLTYNEGEAFVKGLRFISIEKQIDEVTGLLQEGEFFPESKDERSTRA